MMQENGLKFALISVIIYGFIVCAHEMIEIVLFLTVNKSASLVGITIKTMRY
jgi:hypothetical protein